MNLFGKLQSQYQHLWKEVIRPQRSSYSIDMLGPKAFNLENIDVIRQDFQIMNSRELLFQGSIWLPSNQQQTNVMIYLHSNIGNRTQGMEYLGQLIKNNVALCTFDFTACGNAEGQYVTMGYYEQEDIRSVIKHIEKMIKIKNIGLWGRSMGAVSALLYLAKTIEIQAVIIDSPFKNLKSYVQQLGKNKFKIPSLFIGGATKIISKTIEQKAQFSIYNINPLKYSVPGLYYPVFFIAALQDEFVPNEHIKQLYTAYGGQNKQIKYIKGKHNDTRPEECVNQIINFTLKNFGHDWREEIQKKPKKEFDFFEMEKIQEKQKEQSKAEDMNFFHELEQAETRGKVQQQVPKQGQFSLTSMFTSLFSRDKKKDKQKEKEKDKSKQPVIKDGYQQTRKILAKKYQNHQTKIQILNKLQKNELAQKIKKQIQSITPQPQSNLKQWIMFQV